MTDKKELYLRDIRNSLKDIASSLRGINGAMSAKDSFPYEVSYEKYDYGKGGEIPDPLNYWDILKDKNDR